MKKYIISIIGFGVLAVFIPEIFLGIFSLLIYILPVVIVGYIIYLILCGISGIASVSSKTKNNKKIDKNYDKELAEELGIDLDEIDDDNDDNNKVVITKKEVKNKKVKSDLEYDVMRITLKYRYTFLNNASHIYLIFLEECPNYRGKNQEEIMTYIKKYLN